MTAQLAPVLFAVAAGPRLGFGHLLRSRALARALGVPWRVCIRGSASTQRTAQQLGAVLVAAPSGRGGTNPALIVVDDPSAETAAQWVARARRLRVPVASVHDLGIGEVASDLVVDGSAHQSRGRTHAPALRGPAYAILDPSLFDTKPTERMSSRVLVTLGGGAHVRALATRLCGALGGRRPDLEIRVTRGFAAVAHTPSLPHGTWVSAPGGLATELSSATVAIVAGGVTLYEACALGVPVVAVAVTEAQRPTVTAFGNLHAVVDGGRVQPHDGSLDAVAHSALRLLAAPGRRARLARRGTQVVDGNGAARVAARLRQLVASSYESEVPRVS